MSFEGPAEHIERLAEGFGTWMAGTNPPDDVINDVLADRRPELRERVRVAAKAVAARIRRERWAGSKEIDRT